MLWDMFLVSKNEYLNEKDVYTLSPSTYAMWIRHVYFDFNNNRNLLWSLRCEQNCGCISFAYSRVRCCCWSFFLRRIVVVIVVCIKMRLRISPKKSHHASHILMRRDTHRMRALDMRKLHGDLFIATKASGAASLSDRYGVGLVNWFKWVWLDAFV